MPFQMVVVYEWKSAKYLLNVALFHPYMFWSNMRDHILLIIYLLSMQEDIYTIKWFMAFQMVLLFGFKNDTWLQYR